MIRSLLLKCQNNLLWDTFASSFFWQVTALYLIFLLLSRENITLLHAHNKGAGQGRRPACACAQYVRHICYSCLATRKLSISLLVSAVGQASLDLTWSRTPKTHFPALWPNHIEEFLLKRLSLVNGKCWSSRNRMRQCPTTGAGPEFQERGFICIKGIVSLC